MVCGGSCVEEAGSEGSGDASEEGSRGMGSELGISSSEEEEEEALSSSADGEADASSAMKEGRLDFVGADLRRGRGGCFVDFAGRGGLKVGGLRFGAGLEVVGGIMEFEMEGQNVGDVERLVGFVYLRVTA